MLYPITENDKKLLKQPFINYRVRVTVQELDKKVINVLTGISEYGSITIDNSSDIRRTCNFTLLLDNFITDIENRIAAWIGLYYKVEIGVQDLRTDEYTWYSQGIYRVTGASTTYNATNNSLSFDLSDRICELDGTINGQMGGALTLSIPVQYNGKERTLKEIMTYLIGLSNISDYIIDDVGEYYGMPSHNSDYITYRTNNSEWNILPYDLSYSPGDNIMTAIDEVRDLYPDCQAYMDSYGNFCYDMIPTMESEPIVIDSSYIKSVQKSDESESVKYDTSNIKNVTEIFGVTYDIDRYATSTTFSSNTYSLTLSDYSSYDKGDIIAFVPSTTNTGACSITINSLGALPIYEEYTTTALSAGEIEANETCAVKIYTLNDTNNTKVAYYLGQYQPHALCVFTSNENDTKYTKQYFSAKYNVPEKNIVFRVDSNSLFTVQKLGEILDSKSGDSFDNILSNSVAIINAKYYNRKSTTMMDTVVITTVLIPWLDVNVKCTYDKRQQNTEDNYIITSVEHDISSNTTTITAYKFLQLYDS